MNAKISLYTLVLGAVVTVAIFTSYDIQERMPEALSAATRHPETILSQVVEGPDLDKPFDFAGEALPMDNFDIRERLEKELLRTAYYHSSTVVNLKRTARYFPIIEKILKSHGVPADMKYLAVAESDLSNVTSPAGAKGYWQFLEGTAREYGLEVNREVDERMHLEKATEAAAKMLLAYKERMGSWTMAAAAFNRGASGLSKEVRLQRSDNYYELNLNSETARYIFRIVAMKEILGNPQAYGFYIKKEDMYPPLSKYKVVRVDSAIESLGDFAAEQGISYRMLKVYNPWLKTHQLMNAGKKTYEIRIPPVKF